MNTKTEIWRAAIGYLIAGILILASMSVVSYIAYKLEWKAYQTQISNLIQQDCSVALWRLDTFVSGFQMSESLRPIQNRRRISVPAEKWIESYFQIDRQNQWQFSPGYKSDVFSKIDKLKYLDKIQSALPCAIPEENNNLSVQNNIIQMPIEQTISIPAIEMDGNINKPGLNNININNTNLNNAGLNNAGLNNANQELSQRQQFVANNTLNFAHAQNSMTFQTRQQAAPLILEKSKAAASVKSESIPATASPTSPAAVSLLIPLRLDKTLVLVRKTSAEMLCEGIIINQAELFKLMKNEIADLFPDARFIPTEQDDTYSPDRLASLPLRLEPGAWPPEKIRQFNSAANHGALFWLLSAAWLGTIVAYLALGFLLFGAIRLSARREEFVAAVSHELRTPLTTFVLYSEMLDGDMLSPQQSKQYIGTLHHESIRLTTLIENLMAFSRLYRGKQIEAIEAIDLNLWLTQIFPRLSARTQITGMTLELSIESPHQTYIQKVRSAALEQVIWNLIDNSCKFAAGGTDNRIILSLTKRGGKTILSVRDFGAGIAVREKKLSPAPLFQKTVYQAAIGKPGIGLGLPLSEKLLKSMSAALHFIPIESSDKAKASGTAVSGDEAKAGDTEKTGGTLVEIVFPGSAVK